MDHFFRKLSATQIFKTSIRATMFNVTLQQAATIIDSHNCATIGIPIVSAWFGRLAM
jgi:hypothetical protein